MAKFKKGQIPWNKGKKGLHVAWNKGISSSKESIEKMRRTKLSLYQEGKIKPWNKGTKGIQKAWNKGKPWSEESKRNMSEAHKGQIPWIKGKHHTEETRRKLRELKKSKHYSQKTEFKKGQIPWNKGIPMKEETKIKVSKAKKGKKPIPFSEEHKRNISLSRMGILSPMKGKKFSVDHKRKISEASKKLWQNPKFRKQIIKLLTGKHVSEETKRKLSEAHTGAKSSLWKGGISFEPYSTDWTRTLKKIIRDRDNYTCQLCHNKGKEVHHIDYNKKNCIPNNLITLCAKCHAKTGQNREKWKNFFNEIMQQKSK